MVMNNLLFLKNIFFYLFNIIINKKVYKYKQYIIYIYFEILFVSIFSLYNSDLFAGCLSHAHPLVSQCIVK
jgi:hypothetical protein